MGIIGDFLITDSRCKNNDFPNTRQILGVEKFHKISLETNRKIKKQEKNNRKDHRDHRGQFSLIRIRKTECGLCG